MINLSIKCKGLHCPLKQNCLRYTNQADPQNQVYFARIPIVAGVCGFYAKVPALEVSGMDDTPTKVSKQRKPAARADKKPKQKRKTRNKAV
jgi:hypothetical protein